MASRVDADPAAAPAAPAPPGAGKRRPARTPGSKNKGPPRKRVKLYHVLRSEAPLADESAASEYEEEPAGAGDRDSDAEAGDDEESQSDDEDRVGLKISQSEIDALDAPAYDGQSLPAHVPPKVLTQINRLDDNTSTYRHDSVLNWETAIEREEGLESLVLPLVQADEDDKISHDLAAAIHGKSYYMVRQKPYGGDECIAEYVVKAINAARGGFFFLVSACLRATWFEIFEHLGPFFRSGGRGIIVVPINELAHDALRHLQVQQQICAEDAAQSGGGLKFFFTTEHDDQTMHIKELAIFAPGKIMKVNLTANLTGAGFGTGILKARTAAERRMAPQSGENAEFTLLSYDATDPENIAADYLASLSSFWTSLGRDGHLIWPVQALKEVYTLEMHDLKELEKARARARITAKLAHEIRGEEYREVIE
ncbi:hypothetical protein JCM8115_004437 [Rhodotorula mucilaginosa]